MRLFRVSLRGALVLMTLAAGFCYWRDLPRQNAKQFVAFIEAGQYGAAEAMFKGKPLGIINEPLYNFPPWHAELGERTPRDWLRGRYPVTVRTSIGGGSSLTLHVEGCASGMRRSGRWGFSGPPTI